MHDAFVFNSDSYLILLHFIFAFALNLNKYLIATWINILRNINTSSCVKSVFNLNDLIIFITIGLNKICSDTASNPK